MTHANNTIRTTVQASWDAPANYQGSVTFLYEYQSFIELWKHLWTNQTSSHFQGHLCGIQGALLRQSGLSSSVSFALMYPRDLLDVDCVIILWKFFEDKLSWQYMYVPLTKTVPQPHLKTSFKKLHWTRLKTVITNNLLMKFIWILCLKLRWPANWEKTSY